MYDGICANPYVIPSTTVVSKPNVMICTVTILLNTIHYITMMCAYLETILIKECILIHNNDKIECDASHEYDGCLVRNDIGESKNIYHILFNIDHDIKDPLIVRKYNEDIKTNNNTDHDTLLLTFKEYYNNNIETYSPSNYSGNESTFMRNTNNENIDNTAKSNNITKEYNQRMTTILNNNCGDTSLVYLKCKHVTMVIWLEIHQFIMSTTSGKQCHLQQG